MTVASHREPKSLPSPLRFLRTLWRLNHALERRSSRMKAKLGITAQQRHVLRCLGTTDGITAGALAELLHLDPGTLSAAVRRLELRGLVARTRDTSDTRRVRLELTKAGRRLDRPTKHTVEEAIEQLLAETSAADMAKVSRVLKRLSELLDGDASQ